MLKDSKKQNSYEVQQKEVKINGKDYADYCITHYCFTASHLDILNQIHDQIDFRKEGLTTGIKNQGNYGTCYAFGAAALIENALLIDQNNYNQSSNTTMKYWHTNAQNASISVQYIVSNSVYGQYDKGGDAMVSINMVGYTMGTYEFERNIPYSSQNMETYRESYNKSLLSPTSITKTLPLVPYQMYQAYNYKQQQVPCNLLWLSNDRFDDDIIQEVMSVLSRGIAVSASMNTAVSDDSGSRLVAYKGGIIDIPCNGGENKMDHQVTFIGYGNYKGEKVWIVKNSWGNWGDQGSFYVPIGKDSFCLEHYAFYLYPLFYNEDAGNFQKGQFSTTAYSGKSQLDTDNNGFIENNIKQQEIEGDDDLTVGEIVLICLVVIVVIIIIASIITCCIKNQNKKNSNQQMNNYQVQPQVYQYDTSSHKL